ncbi:glycosyltransferase [Gammaproteobacteria bacterium]|nr:glycosyltransferase [Gammaproteobacteria bacterium]
MKNIAIILCTYNVDLNYFREQLESIRKQTEKDFYLYIVDDNSNKVSAEKVVSIINEYFPDTMYDFRQNPCNIGFAKNFIQTLHSLPEYKYYCFCDQDDIWLPDKLENAKNNVISYDLYCGSVSIINSDGKSLVHKKNNTIEPTFENSLVESIAGGNTYMFKNSVRNLISSFSLKNHIVSHDWFIYQLASGAGLKITYDCNRNIKYRIHDSNTIGTSHDVYSNLRRVYLLFFGDYRNWISNNIFLLSIYSEHLTLENRSLLTQFQKKRDGNLFHRLSIYHKLGIKRNSFLQNIFFYIALVIKRV